MSDAMMRHNGALYESKTYFSIASMLLNPVYSTENYGIINPIPMVPFVEECVPDGHEDE